ncbi:MAG: hypothetical protein L6420_09210 [Elusimicrobia bacterium]|nr:hypothetical protein [Elusimicrobiota bacterium]
MNEVFDIVLLLALPASGKSEVRKYLANIPSEVLRSDLHIGENLQLDDFPYVHIMRRIDDELSALGKERVFFQSWDKSFINSKDWGTLIHIINEDYDDLMNGNVLIPASAGELICSRIESAAIKAGIEPRLSIIAQETMKTVYFNLEKEAADLLEEKHAQYTDSFDGKTIIIEFARGGPHGSSMPLNPPFGYKHSIGSLSKEILEKAVILYIWVTPEESRRKNEARKNPDDPGSILHHGVPIDVMMNDYGTDDMDWLEENSGKKGFIAIEADGTKYNIPLGRFDNRADKTSFLRDEKNLWSKEKVEAVHNGLKAACDKIYGLKEEVKK